MYKSIILSSCLFGSAYLFSSSLSLINNSLLEKNKIPYQLHILNGITFVISGSVLLYGISSSFCILSTKSSWVH